MKYQNNIKIFTHHSLVCADDIVVTMEMWKNALHNMRNKITSDNIKMTFFGIWGFFYTRYINRHSIESGHKVCQSAVIPIVYILCSSEIQGIITSYG